VCRVGRPTDRCRRLRRQLHEGGAHLNASTVGTLRPRLTSSRRRQNGRILRPVSEQSTRPIFLTEGFVLAVLSAFSYLVAYIYENSYAAPFGIPPELIDLKWTTLFAAASINALLALAVIATITVTAHASRTMSKTKQRLLGIVLPVGVAGVVSLYFMGLSRWRLVALVLLIAVLMTAAFELVPPPAKSDTPSTFWRTLSPPPVWTVYAILTMMMTLVFAMFAGFGNALNTRDFLMTAGSPSQAVVRVYGDKIVTVQYDREAKALIPIYRVLPLTDSGRVFSLEHLPNVMPVCPPISSPEDSSATRLRQLLGSYILRDENLERCQRYRSLRTPASSA
jgi:hypothetical protein